MQNRIVSFELACARLAPEQRLDTGPTPLNAIDSAKEPTLKAANLIAGLQPAMERRRSSRIPSSASQIGSTKKGSNEDRTSARLTELPRRAAHDTQASSDMRQHSGYRVATSI